MAFSFPPAHSGGSWTGRRKTRYLRARNQRHYQIQLIVTTFEALGLDPLLLQAISQLGFQQPTPIPGKKQSRCYFRVPAILSGWPRPEQEKPAFGLLLN